MDNSKHWRGYPKRSKSIVCIGHRESSIQYGNVYRVYPKYNAKIGVCPECDIWWSFKKGLDIINDILYYDKEFFYYSINSLFKFNIFLSDLFKINNKNTYRVIMKKINQYKLNDEQKQILKKYKCKTLFEFIDYCLSPKLNGFQLVKFNENFKTSRYTNKEIWTDADSLLIKEDDND